MIIQLNPPIPVITPNGRGLAVLVLDYGIEHHLHWTVILDHSGECWTFSNPDIRAQKNITAGREYISPFYNPEDAALPKDSPDLTDLDDCECGICKTALQEEKNEQSNPSRYPPIQL